MTMKSVLILGARSPSALEYARRFKMQGWRVFTADAVNSRLSSWSSSVDQFFLINSPKSAPLTFIRDLQKIIQDKSITYLLCTCEEIFYASFYRQHFPQELQCGFDAFDKLESLHSKWKVLELVKQSGGNVPESLLVRSINTNQEWIHQQAVIIKPEYSRFGIHTQIYPNGLPSHLSALPFEGNWVIQKFILGQEVCSFSICYGGQVMAHTCYLPKHRMGKSASYYFEPLHTNYTEAIEQLIKRLCANLQFTGQISFDWMIDETNQLAYVIECNPRATSGLHLFPDSMDIVGALMGKETHSKPNTSNKMILPIMLTTGLGQALHDQNVSGWYKDIQQARDVIIRRNDWLPILGGFADMSQFFLKSLLSNSSMRANSTENIEWDGHDLPQFRL